MLDTLDTRAGTRILRVWAVAPNGVLELEGSDGRTVRVHMERCAPCHRADVDGRIDPRTAVPSLDFACTRCQRPTGAARMLLCDGHGAGWHLECLPQPLLQPLRGTGTVAAVGRGRRMWPSLVRLEGQCHGGRGRVVLAALAV
jgi:hypothetical protein